MKNLLWCGEFKYVIYIISAFSHCVNCIFRFFIFFYKYSASLCVAVYFPVKCEETDANRRKQIDRSGKLIGKMHNILIFLSDKSDE